LGLLWDWRAGVFICGRKGRYKNAATAIRLLALMKSRTLPIRNRSISLTRHCISKAVTSGASIK